MEFACGGRTMAALAVLLAVDNGRGLGDLHAVTPEMPVAELEKSFNKSAEGWTKGGEESFRARCIHAARIGSWAGTRIVIAGDYGDRFLLEPANLYDFARRNFRDISFEMVELLCADPYLRESFRNDDWFQDVLAKFDTKGTAVSARRAQ